MHGMRALRAIGLAAAGALTATGLLGIATIGLPLLALAGALFALIGRDRGLTPGDGFFAFAGAACAFIAFGVAALPSDTAYLMIYAVPAAIALAGALGAAIEQR